MGMDTRNGKVFEMSEEAADALEKRQIEEFKRALAKDAIEGDGKYLKFIEREFGGDIEKAVKELRVVKRALSTQETEKQKIGRNSLCGCGSGIKFKKCCMRKVG